MGPLGHAALEAWFRAQSDEERLEAAIAAIDAHPDEQADPFDKAKVRALIHGYHALWLGEPWEVLAVEVEIPNIPLIHPDTGDIDKEHTANPVPLFLVGKPFRHRPIEGDAKLQLMGRAPIGILGDVAPTILELLALKAPPEMTGRSLLAELKRG